MGQSSIASVRAPIVAIVLFQLAALLARAFLETRLVDGGEPEPFAHDLSYLVVPPILVLLLLPILRQYGSTLLSYLRWQQLSVRLIVVSVLLGFSLRMSFWGVLISSVSFGILRNDDPNAIVGPQIAFGCPDAGVLALSFFVMVCLVPVIEEVINRGMILPTLLPRGRLQALLLSSILFAVFHNPDSILTAFFVGLFLGIQMLVCGTLWGPLITHATVNAIAILDWECISAQWNPESTTTTTIAVGLLAAALAAVGITLCCLLVQKSVIGTHRAPR